MKELFTLLLGLLLILPSELLGQTSSDTLPAPQPLSPTKQANRALTQGLLEASPLIGIGLLQNLQNETIRELRFGYAPHFRNHYDDYLQFAPLAVQIGMRFGGIQGITESPWQMLTADAVASASVLAITSAIKYTARIERPDGSSRNSFPSGHTTMAFASATLLNLEYAERYPWLPAVSYGAASLAGVGRLLNNRHWVGDVVTGAGLGILCGHLGYWVSDRLFGRTQRKTHSHLDEAPHGLRLYVPITLSTSRVRSNDVWLLQGRHAGIGLEYTPEGWPLHLKGALALSLYKAERAEKPSRTSLDERTLQLSLGAGRDFQLWQGFHLNVSAHGALRLALGKGTQSSSPATEAELSLPRTSLGLGLEVAPHWRFTRRIGLRLPLGADYFPAPSQVTAFGAPTSKLSPISLHAGTALEIYL
ncbi:phosphatase PAP2 family protein [uncultured Porphyromonas sp.]|uniref:phosphatase PAP2 family protein n=1 Tax=uncultured Porphyromonas sp. TaxID=159274 RepID=UPI00262973EA|nr:phosphatase PAP2 family protein [uncultured Porphyromonas sp.]